MKKLLLVLLTGFALAGVANASHAQHHRGGFHGPGAGFHGSGFHDRGFHHFHDGRFHDRFAVFLGVPFFWGPEFYPYIYEHPYYYDYLAPYPPPQQDYSYYCPDQGYYPAIQTCPTDWLRVAPERH